MRKVKLTAGEIGALWTSYMNDSMSVCMLEVMLQHIEDPDIKQIVAEAQKTSSSHLEQLKSLFEKEKFAVPNGFGEQDVNPDAPRLFTDIFCLIYINDMAKASMVAYSGFVSMSIREDIREFYTTTLTEAAALYNKTTEIALRKGISARHPFIEPPKETDYVETKKYMGGLNPLQEKRPLNTLEISHLYMNILTNTMGMKLCLAFAQTSPTKEVQEFMLRSRDISKKHIQLFESALMKDDIQTPQTPDIGMSNSTTKTLSDKLMMYHISIISATGIGNYATAAAASQRSDLAVNYERLSAEVARLAKSGADIMIKHNWLEQPPGTKNRDKLAKEKK